MENHPALKKSPKRAPLKKKETTESADEPLAVKLSRSLFLDAQFATNKLQKINPVGKSFLFQDNRAGVVIA